MRRDEERDWKADIPEQELQQLLAIDWQSSSVYGFLSELQMEEPIKEGVGGIMRDMIIQDYQTPKNHPNQRSDDSLIILPICSMCQMKLAKASHYAFSTPLIVHYGIIIIKSPSKLAYLLYLLILKIFFEISNLFIKQLKQLLIKNNNKMKDSSDKENEATTMAITLDFKKKQKPKPNTDRTHNMSANLTKKETSEFNSTNPNPSLLEKKKQYSMAIREKNLITNPKKPKNEYSSEIDAIKSGGATETLKTNNLLLNQTINYDSKTFQKDKSLNTKKLGKENDLKSKVRDVKREMTKIKKMSAAIEDFKSYGLNKWVENEKTLNSRQSQFDSNISRITKIEDFSVLQSPLPPPCLLKLAVNSLEINEVIGPFITQEMKQIQLLKRQNNTFKKQLAVFRKDNGSLKRQLDEYKKQIQDLKEKNDFLSSQNQDNIKLLESFQLKVGESFESFSQKQELQTPLDPVTDSRMKEILSSYESQLFEATSQVKKLEFRNYMLEKRLLDQTESHKKAMAREISMWKERYIKARNENLRLKDSRNSMLFEMSISEEM